MDYFLKSLISGILTGLFYCLISYGFSLTYRISHIINFAHGGFILTGGYIAWFLWNAYKINPLYSIILIIPINIVLAILLSILLIGFETHRETFSLILTLGMALLMQGIIILIFGADYRVMDASHFFSTNAIGSLPIPGERLLASFASIMLLTLSFLIYKFTYTGKVLRAVSMERMGAQLSGVSISTLEMLIFAISAGIAGCSGILVPMLHYINPHTIIELTVISLIVSLPVKSDEGLLLTGLLLGISQALIISYLGIQWRELFIYSTLLFIITLKTRTLWQGFRFSFF